MTKSFLDGTQEGAATLIFTVILLILSTLIIMFAANFGQMQEMTTANLHRNSQAFEAAEAGLEFGIVYLQKNSATILATASGGSISYSDSNTTNVSLANNSKFSVVYTNPVSSNYKLILVTSTGSSDDGTSTRNVSQLVQFGTLLLTSPTVPLVSKNSVSMSNSAAITNTSNNTTIQSGDNVNLNNGAKTILSSGTSSTAGNIRSDISQNLSSLSNKSSSDLFASYFGVPTSNLKNSVAHYYSNSSSTNYSNTLSGMSGTSIWIDQTGGTATVNGFTFIGTSTNPVLMIVNGNLSLGGIVSIYGLIYVIGTLNTDSSNFVSLNGGLITTNSINLLGNYAETYSSTALTNLQNQGSMLYYAKVTGSWKDF